MTEQERELITFLNKTFGHHESDIDSEAFAKRLIQRYPQILGERVGDWDYEMTKRGSRKYYFFTENPVESIFIREVKE